MAPKPSNTVSVVDAVRIDFMAVVFQVPVIGARAAEQEARQLPRRFDAVEGAKNSSTHEVPSRVANGPAMTWLLVTAVIRGQPH
jgi:hypothetical protein